MPKALPNFKKPSSLTKIMLNLKKIIAQFALNPLFNGTSKTRVPGSITIGGGGDLVGTYNSTTTTTTLAFYLARIK